MPDHSLFRLRILPWCIALAMSGSYSSVWAEDDIQFDSRFLELKGDTKIDLKRFSSQGYVEPGKYNLQVQLNKQPLAEEYDIYWYAGEDDASKSYACLTPELVAQFGLKEDVAKNLQWSHDAKCLKSGQLEGMEIKADLSQSALVISLPQAYLEYTYPDWDPPSRWDDGISGIVADYSINAQTRHEENGGDDSNEISGNGTVGLTWGRGVCVLTGRLTINILAVMMMTMNSAAMKLKKMGVESLLCLAGVTIIKSQTGAGRGLPQIRYF